MPKAKKKGFVLNKNLIEIEKAIDAANHGDLSFLEKEIRRGNPEILKHERFKDFVADRVAGKPIRKRGQQIPNAKTKERNQRIITEVALLVAQGLPAFARGEATETENACEIVAEDYHLGVDAITGIWKRRAKLIPEHPSDYAKLYLSVVYRVAFNQWGKAVWYQQKKDWLAEAVDLLDQEPKAERKKLLARAKKDMHKKLGVDIF